MPYPLYSDLELALLQFIHSKGGKVTAAEVYVPLGNALGLSSEEMERTLDEAQGHGGGRRKWENMVQWARNSLAKKFELERPKAYGSRGVWVLTEMGILRAANLVASSLPAGDFYPDEVPVGVWEGAKTSVMINKYERNPDGRRKCLKHYGYKCVVCGFDFEERYGVRGAGFIHVHHLTPLSVVGQSYILDPITDLRPVCPNCHSMLHRTDPPCSVDELKLLLNPSDKV